MHCFSLSLDIHISLLYKPELQLKQHIQWFTCKQMLIIHFLHTIHTPEITQGLQFACYTFIHFMQPLSHLCSSSRVHSSPLH